MTQQGNMKGQATARQPVSEQSAASSPYEVGYGRPPKHMQFVKGRSGRRKRRPKEEESMDALFRRIGVEVIWGRVGGEVRQMIRAEAAFHGMYMASLKRGERAISKVFELAEAAGLAESPSEAHGVLLVRPTMTPEEWAAEYGTSIVDDPTI